MALLSRDEASLLRAAKALNTHVFTVTCDVTDAESTRRAVQSATDYFGRVDMLIHCAGQMTVGPDRTMALSDHRRAMDTHLFGAVHAVHAVLPQMRRRGFGHIVLISSVGGRVGVPHMVPYSASKFALGGYGEALHAELVSEGIGVTTVYPGLMRTGSPRNADFKGQHRREYAWFSLLDSLPFISISAKKAAERIIEAGLAGRSELVLMPMGRLMLVVKALMPEVVAKLVAFAGSLLPAAAGAGYQSFKGYESESSVTRSFLTALTRRAALRNNELPEA